MKTKTFPVLSGPLLARRQPRFEVVPDAHGLLRSRRLGLSFQRSGDLRAGEGGAESLLGGAGAGGGSCKGDDEERSTLSSSSLTAANSPAALSRVEAAAALILEA